MNKALYISFLLLFSNACATVPSEIDRRISSSTECAGLFNDSKVTFGSEFTFRDNQWPSRSMFPTGFYNAKARDKMAELMREICKSGGDCTVTTSRRKWLLAKDYVVTYKDGWSWRISTDHGVLEIQTSPATIEQFKALKSRIDEHIFKNAKNLGLEPHEKYGGGHIHIGVRSAFEGNASLFRNFLVDLENHQVPNFGSSQDGRNANLTGPSWKKRNAFESVIRDFDEGKITTIEGLARALQDRVYRGKDKEQAVNVTRIVNFALDPNRQTIEFRKIDPQQNMNEFLLQIEVFQARLRYLKTINGRIEYRNSADAQPNCVSAFYGYIDGAGLSWSTYGVLMPPAYDTSSIITPKQNTILPHTISTADADQSKQAQTGVWKQFSLRLLFNLLKPGY